MTKIAKILATLATATVLSGVATAQDIRFVAWAGDGLYEVVPGLQTGGRLVRQRWFVHTLPVHGYTDRAQRGDIIFAIVPSPRGLDRVSVSLNGKVQSDHFFVPHLFTTPVITLGPNASNYVVAVRHGRGYWEKRMPIGTRAR